MIQFTNNAVELFLLTPVFLSVMTSRVMQLIHHFQAVKAEAAKVEQAALRVMVPSVRDVAAKVVKESEVIWKKF